MTTIHEGSVRKLTDEERAIYTSAVKKALDWVPSFRDCVALLRPFFDANAETAYTDEHARVGLSPWFFQQSPDKRATILLHEAMHVLNDHFVRGRKITNDGFLSNLAGDFEINCSLAKLPKADVSGLVYPNRDGFDYPEFESMERYLKHFDSTPPGGTRSSDERENGEDSTGSADDQTFDDRDSSNDVDSNSTSSTQGDENGSDSSKEHQAHSCSPPSPAQQKAIDELGIEPASESEVSVARANTRVHIAEERKKSALWGSGANDEFFDLVELQLRPPRIPWRSAFARVLSLTRQSIVRGRRQSSLRRLRRRPDPSGLVLPGTIAHEVKILIGVDTSGSMTQKDYMVSLNEIDSIARRVVRNKKMLELFAVDGSVKKTQVVRSVDEIELRGGGGTNMTVALRYVQSLSKKQRPDIFILVTDAGTDWRTYENEWRPTNTFKHFILVTSRVGFESMPDSIKRFAIVFDVSED